MKDCCNVGQKKKSDKPNFKMWFNNLLYAIIASIVIGAIVIQIIKK